MSGDPLLDIRLIVGPRGCGKSERTEVALATAFSRRLYVGTLWAASAFEKSLRAHRARRDVGWSLVECTGEVQEDIRRIDAALAVPSAPAACLIDGLTTWVIHCSRSNGDVMGAARTLGECVAELVLARPEVTWRLIDVLPSAVEAEGEPLLAEACRLLQSLLRTYLEPCGLKCIEEP